ncbi:MAG: right-handed parallel beta-helix repeat-containing protein, partial [Candidatus Aminicenantaceae bacterium]
MCKRIMQFCLMVLVVVTVAKVPVLAAEITVYGENNPVVDVPAVQFAVDTYKNVILEGTFDFGTSWVDITMPGLTLEGSENGCLIKNGDWPFGAYPIGSNTPYNLTIRNLVIDNPGDYGIYVYGVKAPDNLMVIEGCTITNAILQGIHWCNNTGSAEISGNSILGHASSYGIGTHDNAGNTSGDYLRIIGNTIDGRAGLVSLRNDMAVTIEDNSVKVASAGIGYQSAGAPFTQRDPDVVIPGVIRNNSLEMSNSFAMFLGDYYHGATNVLVQNNTITGYCMVGMWVGPWGGWNTIMENDLSGLTTYDAQVWESARHDVFTKNVFGPVEYITAIDIYSDPHP